MHHADIAAALKKRGYTLTRIANELGCSRSLVSEVVYNRKRSRRVADRIAKRTRLPLRELWPGVYTGKRSRAAA